MLKKISYRDVMRFTWYNWRRRIRLLPVLFAGMTLTGLLDTLFPVFVGRLVDAVTAAGDADGQFPSSVVIAFAVLMGVEMLYHPARNGTIALWNSVAATALSGIVNEAFQKVQRFSADWHAGNFGGATVRKISRGMWAFDTYEDILFMYLYPTMIVLVATVGIMAWHWPVMGLVTLAAALLYVGVGIWTVVAVNAPRFRRSAARDTAVGAALADAITANSVIKAFGTEEAEDRRFAVSVVDWRKAALHSWQVANGVDLLRRYVSVLMMAAMAGTALWLWKDGKADAGDVVYVLTGFIVLSAYLRHMGEQISNLQRAISEMEDIIVFWKHEDQVRDAPGAPDFVPGRGEIEFDAVRFVYDGAEDPLYDGFSIAIRPGEKVALVGPSGSGKSTFVKLVQRLYDIQGGQIRIDGQDISTVKQVSLRRSIALVPQDPILFHRSLAENIAYGNPGASMEEIEDAARQAYAHDFITALPQGYDTPVGERGVKLSGGERQRVAIARAILADAPILILDEATSSLDSMSEAYIQKALERLETGRTTIVIAHRLSTIKTVDRILVFDQGRIVEQGTHAELLAQPGSHYKELYEMQVLGLQDGAQGS